MLSCIHNISVLREKTLEIVHVLGDASDGLKPVAQRFRTESNFAGTLLKVFLPASLGQPVGTSELYQAFLRSGGLPYRHGEGFYIPGNCTYVVDYYTQCGGSGAACQQDSGVCADAQYPGACCPSGFYCE